MSFQPPFALMQGWGEPICLGSWVHLFSFLGYKTARRKAVSYLAWNQHDLMMQNILENRRGW